MGPLPGGFQHHSETYREERCSGFVVETPTVESRSANRRPTTVGRDKRPQHEVVG
jgi:hypothetical protein